jgi:hypothetical protein
MQIGDIVRIVPDIDVPIGSLIRNEEVGVVSEIPQGWRYMVYVTFPFYGKQAIFNKWLQVVGHVEE